MKRLAAAACAALLLLTAACTDDGGGEDIALEDAGDADETTTSEATTTTVADETTTTTTAVDETTTVTAPLDEGDGPAIPSDPEAYATALIRAWEVGDAPVAEVFATDEAFDTLFAYESGGVQGAWQVQFCEGAAGSSYCTFSAGGDPTVVVRVLNELASQSSPDAVIEVQVSG